MDETITARLMAQEEKIDKMYASVEKTRKYLLIIMWSSVAMIVLPIIVGIIIVPIVISSYTSMMGGLL